jgi:molybdopterin synthase sulfur carrier subunit
VKVSFYATLRPVVGAKTLDFAVPEGATVRELVGAIVAQHPDLRPMLLNEAGAPTRGVHVFVNGRGAGFLAKGLETPLSADDTVDVFPAVAGG